MRARFPPQYRRPSATVWKLPLLRALLIVAIAVLPFVPSADGQCERAKLVAEGGLPLDRFGFAVGVSGSVIVVGSPYDDEAGYNYGAAYVFERAGAVWPQIAKLFAPEGFGGGVGRAVAVDGDIVVVGARGAWTMIFERSADGWTRVADLIIDDYTPGSLYGDAVAVAGDTVLVAAPQDDDNGADSGSVYVFRRAPEGTWSQEAKLLASDGDGYDRFGHSVAICGDIIGVGARDDEALGNWSGSAYVFERDPNGVWQETAKLLPHDGSAFWSFGESVAVSGNRVLVGATTAYAFAPAGGAAYIFERDPNEAWIEVKQLVSDDIANSDSFGITVALEGDVALIGAENTDYNAPDSGAAYVFVRQPDGTWPQVAKIGASDGGYDDRFGRRVALSGSTALIGAHYDDDNGDDAGAAYVFAVGPDEDGDGIMDVCLCPGDLDHDLDVDLSDLAQLLSNYGTTSGMTYEDGDLDEDGDVDLADLAALLAEYGTICP